MGFFKRLRTKQQQRGRIDRLTVKLELDKLKYKREALKNKRNVTKWDKLADEKDAVLNFAEGCADEYQQGGISKLLQDPNIQEIIKALIPKLLSGSIATKAKALGALKQLPPDAQKTIMDLVKK